MTGAPRMIRDTELRTTGKLRTTADGWLESLSPKMRAVLKRPACPVEAELQFRFLGGTSKTEPFGNPENTWRQLGFKLFEANQCNNLYVMWKFEKPPGLVPEREHIRIEIKRNPGMSTHSECKNRNYETLARVELSVSALDGECHRLRCTLRSFPASNALIVSVDGDDVMQADISDADLKLTRGTTGIRSDNARVAFGYWLSESVESA